MIRPTTAPLAVLVGVLVLVGGGSAAASWRHLEWRRAAVFGAFAALGPLLVLWSNTMLFGGPLEAGYKGAAGFFRWEHVWPNLVRYPSWLIDVHSVVAMAGFAAVPLALWRRSAEGRHAAAVALSATAFVVLNLAIIVPYLNFEQWTYLRFVLPAMVALFVLLAALAVWTAEWLAGRSRLLAPFALIPAVVVAWQGAPEARRALNEWRSVRSVLLMGPYLREMLPPDAVVMAYLHSGSVAYYGRRPIVRLDIVQPDLDVVIARLQAMGSALTA
jgi:hypothetical protein